ncbi:FKBP-type peptidyl-prolyl cis-trans isomerase [Gulosibacter faecalis]|uniref:Peptidylprolyl isomerase n=1 Tax=Gulosibacter faecalis TaxID=272240 RepID=A0ABW5V026_9MICO|nr:hypothetical protein [Gulosibacter faecalis]
MIAPRRLARIGLAGSLIIPAVALAACAQVPSSELVSSCTPAESVQVEHTGGSGTGPVINDGGIAEFTFSVTLANGTEVFPETSINPDANGNPLPVNTAALGDAGMVGVEEAMQCATSGEHITATMELQQIFSGDMFQFTEEQLTATATVEINVERVYHSAATGSIAPQHNGIPAVVTAPDGTPGVTMPNEAAPTEVRSATTIAGNGPALKAGDTITAQFSAFEWTSSTQIATSWGGKAPIQTEIGADNDGLFGATAELQGVQVGSQRVIVVPAATVAANTAAGTMPVGNGDAIVLVIDILGSTPAEQ